MLKIRLRLGRHKKALPILPDKQGFIFNNHVSPFGDYSATKIVNFFRLCKSFEIFYYLCTIST